MLRRWGPARIGNLLGLHPSTVHRVLTRYRLARLAWFDRATGRVVRRYERARPGELVHVEIKKLGRIPDGGGWRVLGRALGGGNSNVHRGRAINTAPRSSATTSCTAIDDHFLHTAIDDHPLAYSELRPDETAAAFWTPSAHSMNDASWSR